jgi:SAM-dependent methyltransferase
LLLTKFYQWIALRAEKAEFECRECELSLFDANPKAEILDLGCGDGTVTLKIAERIGSNKIHAVEIDPESIISAQKKGINVISHDLNEALSYADSTFDVIVASHVIEHLSNTDIFIKEIYRILKSNGYLILATPNLAAWPNIILLLFGRQPSIAEISDETLAGTWSPRRNKVSRSGPAHRRIFTPIAICEFVIHHKFQVDAVVPSGFLPFSGLFSKMLSHMDRNHATNIIIRARKLP